MGGNWSDNPLPIRAGSYINFESSGSAPVEPGDFGRVGMPIRATWGPVNEFVDIVTDADRTATYGNTDGDPTSSTDTSWLIREAIIGGAELVKAYRMVGAGSAAATVDLDDWVGDPLVTLDALYDGSRANGFNIEVAASPLTGSAQLSILEGGVAIERFTYVEDDVADLVDQINGVGNYNGSAYVSATLLQTPETNEVTTLTVASGSPLTAGSFTVDMDFGDGNGIQSTASIAYNSSTVADVQSAIDTVLAAAGYTAGDIAVTLTGGADGFDVDDAADTEYTLTAGGGLANQNIDITITPTGITGGPITVATTQEGARSPLAYGTSPMAGGADGAALSLTDYTNAMTAFEAEGGFDLFAFDGVSEEDFAGFNTAVRQWTADNNRAGRYVMTVIGGGDTELSGADVNNAIARSAELNADIGFGEGEGTEFMVNIGVSGLEITSPAGNVLQLNSAQSSARLAGLIANSGITGSITFTDTGADAVNGPLTPAQIEAAIQQGVIVFGLRGDTVRVEDGITAFTTLTDEKDFTFTQIRAVRAIQQIGLDVSEIVETDWIGQRINTPSVRDALVARLETYFGVLEAQNVLVNGTEVQIDTRYDNTTTNVFVLVLAQFQFELKKVLLTVRVPTVS